jgi:hypothetical protein
MTGEKGGSGKFLTQQIEQGRKRMPEKMRKYPRKKLKGTSKKGRREYPWRKKHG